MVVTTKSTDGNPITAGLIATTALINQKICCKIETNQLGTGWVADAATSLDNSMYSRSSEMSNCDDCFIYLKKVGYYNKLA